LLSPANFTEPSPRKNFSMDESYDVAALPEGLNKLIKKDDSPYNTER